MKNGVLTTFFLLNFAHLPIAQPAELAVDRGIAELLVEEKLNFQFFELAMVLPELANVIESDTSDLLSKRVQHSFDSSLSIETRYVNSLDFCFLFSKFKSDSSISDTFPKAFELISSLREKVVIETQPIQNFASIYKEYIEYPEQMDDITIITLLTANDCKFFEEIQADQIAMYNFNNWLEYGFDEFRYYPDFENPVRLEINNRLTAYLSKNVKCTDNVLVQESLKMIDRVVASYR